LISKKKIKKIESPFKVRLQNHFSQNFYIGNKKALFYNLKSYYQFMNKNVFEVIPLTFHICKGIEDKMFGEFLKAYALIEEEKKTNKDIKNIWIMKPG